MEEKAREAVERFLSAWKQQDWQAMFDGSQKTWQAKAGSTPALLSEWFPQVPQRWEIQRCDRIGEAMQAVWVELDFSKGFTPKKSLRKIMVIGETGPYEPSADGTWGVNPVSVLAIQGQG